ncbi:MAG TPA: lysophospholipid acyltransferase family protein, partial [Mobilitalea sp.]|nr:lysophospholipid acyltransferase family protein [Mobilitalea sp.]
MRLILLLLFLLMFFIISIPLFIIEFIIGKFNRRAQVSSSQKIVTAAFHVVLFLAGVKRTVIGKENIPKNEPVLYIANHRSYFDVPVTFVSLPTLTGYMAKIEIARIPILRTWMRL